jgi:hypothetical protein
MHRQLVAFVRDANGKITEEIVVLISTNREIRGKKVY